MQPIPNINEDFASFENDRKISRRWYDWFRYISQFDPSLYAKLAADNQFKGSMLRLTTSTGDLRFQNVNGPVEVHIRPDAGHAGYLTFTEDAVADRWVVGIKPADGSLYFGVGNAASWTEKIHLNSAGCFAFAVQDKVLQGPNNTGIYLNWTDGWSYYDTQNGIHFRDSFGSTLMTLDSSGGVTSTGGIAAGNGYYYTNAGGVSKIVIEDANDGWLRLNPSSGAFSNGIYTAYNLRTDGALYLTPSNYIHGNSGFLSYGSAYISGAYNSYHGLAIYDGSKQPTFMTNGTDSGVYNQAPARWSWYDDNTNFNIGLPVVCSSNITAYSDARLKKDIVPLTGALSRVSQMQGIEYTRTDTGAREIGLIAQNLISIRPEVVGSTKHGTLTVAYGNLVAELIEAIKELNSEVQELKHGIH